jgi:hypothetical protein
MDSVNKVISFILGLIVVVVFIAIVTGKFKLGNNLKNLSKVKVSPTVTVKTSPTPTSYKVVNYNSGKTATPTPVKTTKQTNGYTSTGYQAYNSNAESKITANNNLSTIPNTGAPTFLIPSALSMLAGGAFLKKLSRKK